MQLLLTGLTNIAEMEISWLLSMITVAVVIQWRAVRGKANLGVLSILIVVAMWRRLTGCRRGRRHGSSATKAYLEDLSSDSVPQVIKWCFMAYCNNAALVLRPRVCMRWYLWKATVPGFRFNMLAISFIDMPSARS